MASDPHRCKSVLTPEQLQCISRPRDVTQERATIAAAKVDLALLAMLSAGTISRLLPGEKAGAFWVTKHYRLVAEPHQVTLGSLPEVIELCDRMKANARDRLDMIAREERARKTTTSPGNETGDQYPGTLAIQLANPIEQEISLCREWCSRVDSLKNTLRNWRIDYRFGLVLDNTGTTNCICCMDMLIGIANGCGCNRTQCPSSNNLAILLGTRIASTRIIDVYARQEGLQVSDAVAGLCDKLGILLDAPFSEPPSIERSRIIKRKTTELPPHPRSVPFTSPNAAGQLVGLVSIQLNQDETKSIIPYTPVGWSAGVAEDWAPIPFSKPYPLLNWAMIHSNSKATVFLTDCIDLVALARDSNVIRLTPEIWTSWYIGKDAVPDVNWTILKGRKVTYALFCHSGLLMRDVYETALAVYFELRDTESVDLSFMEFASVPPCDWERWMTPEEFIESAKDMGLSKVVSRLREKRLLGMHRPEGLSEMDATEEPCDFLLHPFLCRGDVSVLYGNMGLGKTALALRIGLAVAFGYPLFDPLCAKAPGKVLYLEAEVGRDKTKRRIASAMRALGITQGAGDGDSFYYRYERLSVYSQEGRCRIDKMLSEVEKSAPMGLPIALLVIDNLTSLVHGTDTSAGWDGFYSWACEHRDRGISVLILHHENDEGSIKGTKDKLINADNVIHLVPRQSKNVDDDVAFLRVSCVFEKLRNRTFPEALFPMDVDYDLDRAKWSMVDVHEYRRKVMQHQVDAGYTDERMSEYWGLEISQIKWHRKKYGMKKYNVGDESPSSNGELRLLP